MKPGEKFDSENFPTRVILQWTPGNSTRGAGFFTVHVLNEDNPVIPNVFYDKEIVGIYSLRSLHKASVSIGLGAL